ncbi:MULTISPECIES: siderophore-interacting protein [Kitasatospora]|uniref:Putative siderophore-interacting protein n=1 Tax=Kitasatospora setae (strain ATCC 33774 / DSM 43861 / JCM 3304 / KCC A-0304 / NBRC 14216 / KM-6054) TaxID=452652 RepID=E4NDR8_KITSK|nr:siderophore-interacting protein [Kitasatospora setae]BAJ29349.1 putative siderophore-interacting protein [Kitasatospora setae KM-6054]
MTDRTPEFDFFPAHVVRTRRLGPTMLRVTFGGGALRSFASGGRDQSCSLFLPHPGQAEPNLPYAEGEGWFAAWRALPADERAVLRSYTVRAQRAEPPELDVDFALHGTGPEAGPASAWAAAAGPGARVVLLGPAVADNRSVAFRPPADADFVLLLADETALPAAGGILEWLPAGTRALVWIEVPDAADIQDLAAPDGAELHWLVRAPGAPSGLPPALRAADLPPGTPYAWIAGEAGAVRELRRHLVRERGVDRRAVAFSGYWRRGASEDRLRAEASAGRS